MSLPGPSRTITIEPIETPERAPVPALPREEPAPPPRRAPEVPAPAGERPVPA